MNHVRLHEPYPILQVLKILCRRVCRKYMFKMRFSPRNIPFLYWESLPAQTLMNYSNKLGKDCQLWVWGYAMTRTATLVEVFIWNAVFLLPTPPQGMAPPIYQNHSGNVGATGSSLDCLSLNTFVVMIWNYLLAVLCFHSRHFLKLPFSTEQIK